MLALGEKQRCVVVLRPDVCSDAEGEPRDLEVVAKLEKGFLEVKAKKKLFLGEAGAESFFHFLPPEQRAERAAAFGAGLCAVLVVEHLEGDAIERTCALARELEAEYGEGSVHCSQSAWESMRDVEFFFPFLDALPTERTLALMKADGLAKGSVEGRSLEEAVEDLAAEAGLLVVARKEVTVGKEQAELLCEGLAEQKSSVGQLLSQPEAVALLLEGNGAVGKWSLLCGPQNSGAARERAPTTLRARWGTDGASNAVHGSASLAASEKEIRAFFPDGSLRVQRTLCIVKPDAMRELLEIRGELEAAGFTVLKEKQLLLAEDRARDFYRDHKEKPYFAALVSEACEGPCCALVLCRLEAVAVLLQLLGPEATKEAKGRRPRCLRARFGHDGQRNGLHGSASSKCAAREVRFFFPELGADPVPDDDDVRDFLFRKSAVASMDLNGLDSQGPAAAQVDETLQQLLSRGLMALCQVQPKGLAAVKWLSRWLAENNPNSQDELLPRARQTRVFNPPERAAKRIVEYGVNQEGMAFSVEAPPPVKKKQVIEVDVSEEAEENRVVDLKTPPLVVFVLGGPGSGKGTQCARLREQFNFVHLSTGDLMREEVASKSYLGTELQKHMSAGTLVPDSVTLQLLKKAMVKHQETNRFLLDGFPRSLEQAKRFEQEIAEVAFLLYFEASPETMKERISERAAKAPGRVDDNPETVEKRLRVYQEQTFPVVGFYGPIGKVRTVDAERGVEEVYEQARRFFLCRFVYMLGPPGAPVERVSGCLEAQYGYASVNFPSLMRSYAASEQPDAKKVKEALAKGKPIEASVACPLVLAEISKGMAQGKQNFVLAGFPQSQKQVEFLEYRVPCLPRPVLLDFSRADAYDLAASSPGEEDVAAGVASFFGQESQAMLKQLPGLVRIPCSLAGIESAEGPESFEERLAQAAWGKVAERLRPSATLVLGPPCSGTSVLAPLLASSPNTQAVDCSLLLDREMERKTDVGVAMHNMLTRGQVVPFSTTLQLLKGVLNLSCSDSLVLENCPVHADQIEYLAQDFRVERAFQIAGDAAAVAAWKEEYERQGGGPDFGDRASRLEPILQHFGRLGRLERLEVSATPDAEVLRRLVEQATLPRFALVTGLSGKLTPEQAERLAEARGCKVATVPGVVEWAQAALGSDVDASQPGQFLPALKKFAQREGGALLVLQGYPTSAEEVAPFLEAFGEPKVVVDVEVDEERMQEEFDEAHAEDENPPDPETVPEFLAGQRSKHGEMVRAFRERVPKCVLKVEGKLPAAEVSELIQARLLPRAYVLAAPAGEGDFAGVLADGICGARTEGGRREKLSVLDCGRLFQPGGHSPEIEEKLLKASYAAEAPGCVPASLWKELFREAFAGAAEPLGAFVLTNFPAAKGFAVGDQLDMLESVSAFMGVLHVGVSAEVFSSFCSGSTEDYERHRAFSEAVQAQAARQLPPGQLCEVRLEAAQSIGEAVRTVTAAFQDFQARLES